jgi:hypothetical protein
MNEEKMNRFRTIFITGLIIFFLFVACSNEQSDRTTTKEGTSGYAAEQVLRDFIEDMHSGRYQEAVELYGGSYQALIENNTDVSPKDHAKLLENACRINGFQCLDILSAKLEKEISATEFSFRVEFQNEDGTLFVRGPCCGGNATDFPPESSFRFTVIKDKDGEFMVMDLPPYVP